MAARVALLEREQAEALEREQATADVLRIISRSPENLNESLQAVADTAARLCRADFSRVWLRDGDFLMAGPSASPLGRDDFRQPGERIGPLTDQPGQAVADAVRTGHTIHAPDILRYAREHGASARALEHLAAVVNRTGHRTGLAVPLLRGDVVVGVLALVRLEEVRPFSDREIALAETFADQAVIAIENARLFQELHDSLERQTATADVLQVISRSPVDLEQVLQTVVESAQRLCDADGATVFRPRDGTLHAAASCGRLRTAGLELPLTRGSVSGRAFLERRAVHVPNLGALVDSDYPDIKAVQEQFAYHSALAIPLLRDGAAIGTLSISRAAAHAFSDAQVALLQTFADQAVIAIENARLFTELQERNAELHTANTALTESLDRQTATAEILEVISNSPTDVQPVLDAIGVSALRLCRAETSAVFLRDGDDLVIAAGVEQRDQSGSLIGARLPIHPSSFAGRAVLDGHTLHIPDLIPELYADHVWESEDLRRAHEYVQEQGIRSLLIVPMLREGTAVGALGVYLNEARPFTDAQTAMLETFAAQAVIAIENARLFQELQQRLAEQEATAGVLRAISDNPGDETAALQEVTDAVLRLCHVEIGRVWLRDGDDLVAGPLPSGVDWRATGMYAPGARWHPALAARHLAVLAERRTRQYDDLVTYSEAHDPPEIAAGFRRADLRSSIVVPLLHGERGLGVLALARTGAVRPFTPHEVTLAESFAAQAAIAIENARLFDELQAKTRELEERNTALAESLEQQTATSDILGVISRSPTQLQPVLDAVIEAATRLCDAPYGTIWRSHGDELEPLAMAGLPDDLIGEWRGLRSVDGRAPGKVALLERHTAQTADVFANLPPHPEDDTPLQRLVRRLNLHSTIAAPMLRGDEELGVLVLVRTEVRPFSNKQVALLQTFADQAVIAIENARLFEEIQAKSRELEERNTALAESLEQQTAMAEILGVINSSATDIEPVLRAVTERAVRLCNVDAASFWRRDGDEIHRVVNTGEIFETPGLRGLIPTTERIGEPGPNATAAATGRMHRYTLKPDDPRITDPIAKQRMAITGPTSGMAVPLQSGDGVIGVLEVFVRGERRFTSRDAQLLQTFADQAAIAIENSRLFEEIQTKNRELTEALEQQTVTGEVLRIISSAPTDLQRVLNAVASGASRLCNADYTLLSRTEGGVLRRVGSSIPDDERVGGTFTLDGGPLSGRAVREQRLIAYADMAAIDDTEVPNMRSFVRSLGMRAGLAVPLIRDGETIGAFSIMRREPIPFSDKEIALVQTFADQAVIAIENARLFEELQTRTRELEAASRAKSDFLSRMSHELRTPLNAIIGFAEIMEMDPATSPRQRERAGHIHQGGRHLLGLINEVLDITRIEAGRLSLSPEPVRLDAVVQEVLDLERPLAADAQVSLVLDDPDAFAVAVHADRQRLRQIILNLVANAVKYNRPGGRVTLSVSSQGRGTSNEGSGEGRVASIEVGNGTGSSLLVPYPSLLRLTVRDTGPGIPADQIGRLFEPFERLSAETGTVEGTGLGLAIARGLAEAMGGAIGVESVVGDGSTFWVELPAASAPFSLPEAEELARTMPNDEPRATATVLYIEDNQPNVELVQHILGFRPGVTLLTAPDGASGVRIARRYQPDLILLDLNLPDLQGDDVLARLRAEERTAAIPVVMISADATPGQIDRLLAAGAREYLTKPLDVKRLLAIVDGLTAGDGGRNADQEPHT
jgi:GAF domain-containing protein/ActR/RegA family two-component response regulator